NDQLDTVIFSAPTYGLPYTENFEANDGFWRGFGENETWKYGTPAGSVINSASSGTKSWVTLLSDNYLNNDSAWLESPCIDFSSAVQPIFECMLWADGEADNDGLTLQYSLNEGTSWLQIPTDTDYSFDWNWYNNPSISSLASEGWDSINNGWFKVRQTLPDTIAGFNAVKFRFMFESNDTIVNEGFAVDDVRIYEAPVDAGVDSIIHPFDDCYLSVDQEVKISIKNYGIREILPKDSLFAKVILNNDSTLIDTFYVDDPVAIDDTVQFTFKGSFNLYNKENYKLTSYTYTTGDTLFYTNVYNDSISDTISVYGEPNYSLGPDIGTLTPDAVILDAGAGFSTYVWRNIQADTSHNDRYFDVPEFGVDTTELDFEITIQNDSGCYAMDTIKVVKSISDLGIDSVYGTVDTCVNRQLNQYLEVEVKNFSADTTYIAGCFLTVGYQINNQAEVIEQFELSDPLAIGDTVVYRFSNPPFIADSGAYSIKVFTKTYADLNYNNDTSYFAIKIFPLPEVEIGPDTVYTIDAITEIVNFDAYSDYFASYKWQDATEDSTLNIVSNESITYYVEVADTNGCSTASDTVRIISDNWLLDNIIAPQNSCLLTESEQVSIHILNSSPNTYLKDFEITAKLIFQEITSNETITLPYEISPDEGFDFTFTPNFDLSIPGSYSLNITIYPELDNSFLDNKITETIDIWGVYPVDIGPDSIVTKKADSIKLEAANIYNSYLWQNGSTNYYYYINSLESNDYYVSVSDINNCSNSVDTVKIVAYDIGVTEILSPASSCELSNSEIIRFSIRNFGPDIVSAGTNMDFFYRINGGSWINKKYELSIDLPPNASTNVIIEEEIELLGTETYAMELYSRWNRDHFYENDTAFKSIYEFDSPEVNLGEDIYTTQADTVTIDGGEGQTTYTWSDGSHNRYFDVTQNYTETYDILVSNSFGCLDRDTITIFTYDIGIASIAGLSTCENSLETHVTINIEMFSQDTLHAGDEIIASYDYDEDEVSETITLTEDFTLAATLEYTFTETLSIEEDGTYAIECSVEMENEVLTDNNSLNSEFRVGPFAVDLGDDINSYESSVVLDAGAGYSSYIWSSDETTQTIEVSESGEYKVTVSDENACSSSDSINVLFLNPLYEITEILGLSDACTHNEEQTISFKLLNGGNDTIYADSIINIEYFVNWGAIIQEEYTFTEKFIPNDEIILSFTTKADLSQVASHLLRTTAYFGELTTFLDSTINTWGLPIVTLGDDIQSDEDEVILDAGEGFVSYLWNTEASTQQITVIENGTYWVEVSDANGCTNRDTVNVYFVPVALKVTSFTNPTTGCDEIIDENVVVKIKNTGTKIIPSGTEIIVAYQLEDESRIDENIEFATNMGPGATLNYTFANNLSISESGIFGIDFYISYEESDIDTSSFSITIYEKPTFFNGEDSLKIDNYPYTIDPNVLAESYLWSTEETTETISVESDDWYALTITDANTCEFSDSVYVMKLTSIYDNWGKQVTIYPNPTSKKVIINMGAIEKNAIIQISDIQGNLIYINKDISQAVEIETSEWEDGVYIVRIFNDKHHALYQLIKQ
ncbi:MAG: T9SS type A sorting domain-containing protein, partial [Salinivirgaceae bacterium]|nr:T9SS type A sorting domain-containing protein [Salinivirgaceae bacterium]